MARVKPRIKIPYKRYEKSFERAQNAGEQEEEGFIVMKDITANPSVVTTNLKHERPSQEEPVNSPDTDNKTIAGTEPSSGVEELSINKKIKIRRKIR